MVYAHIREADVPLLRAKGQLKVEGSCIIFPRYIWERHGFGVPGPFSSYRLSLQLTLHQGGLPVWLSLDVKLWRDRRTNPEVPEYPWLKRIRCSLYMALRKHRSA